MEREKILNGLRCHAGCEQGFDCDTCDYIGHSDCSEILAKDALNLLKEQPEIVRCKDCWKREFDNCPFNEFCGFKPDDDWFCADGERRNDDD